MTNLREMLMEVLWDLTILTTLLILHRLSEAGLTRRRVGGSYLLNSKFVSDPNNLPVDFKCREFLANNCGYMDEAKGNSRCFDSYNGKLLMGSMLKGSNRMCLASDIVLAYVQVRGCFR